MKRRVATCALRRFLSILTSQQHFFKPPHSRKEKTHKSPKEKSDDKKRFLDQLRNFSSIYQGDNYVFVRQLDALFLVQESKDKSIKFCFLLVSDLLVQHWS